MLTKKKHDDREIVMSIPIHAGSRWIQYQVFLYNAIKLLLTL